MSQSGTLNTSSGSGSPIETITTDSGIATPDALFNINLVGGPGLTTSLLGGSGPTIYITAVAASFKWNVVTSADNTVTLVNENRYIAKGAGIVQPVLPAAATD